VFENFLAFFSAFSFILDGGKVLFQAIEDTGLDLVVFDRGVDNRDEARSGISHEPVDVVLEVGLRGYAVHIFSS
jgi:hypothetical protein